MIVTFGPFQGVTPRTDPYLLQVTQAEDAVNCYFSSGALQSLREAQLASVPLEGGSGDLLTLYRHDTLAHSYWLSFRGAPADLVPSPVSRDTYRRLYFTSAAYSEPRMVSEDLLAAGQANPGPTTYALGVPAPDSVDITASIETQGNSTDATLADSRYYAVTWVTRYGEESAPSELLGQRNEQGVTTGPLVVYPNSDGTPGTVKIVLNVPFPTVAECGVALAKANIYRTLTGSSATQLQYVGTINLFPSPGVVNNEFLDDVLSSALAEVIQTATWTPPQAGLTGLTGMSCGSLAGFVGRQLCFSEPYYPHAWPVAYERPVEDDIVGLGVFGRSLLVLTTRNPWLYSGDHPSSMERQRIDDGLACVSKRSIVDIGTGILYATPEGIMYVGSSGAQMVSANHVTRREWKTLAPESIHAYNYGGRYVAFYDTGTLRGGFILDLDGNWSWLSGYATAGWYDSKSGYLHLVEHIDGVDQTFLFDAGNPQACSWLSRPLAANRAMNFGAARVRADGYPVTLALYSADPGETNQPVYSVSLASEAPVRLPAGYRSDKYRIRISTAGTVHKCWLAETMQELVAAQ